MNPSAEIDKILRELLHITPTQYYKGRYQPAKLQLLELINEARRDELEKLLKHILLGSLGEPYSKTYISDRIKQLSSTNGEASKGDDDEL